MAASGDENPFLPPDFNDQVRDMILEGKPPPEAWRPFIKRIAFDKRWLVPNLEPLAALASLEELYFEDGRYFREYESNTIAPLAGLISLRQLVLAELPVEDIEPLAGLVDLVRLDLRHMPIADISALARLTKLEWLDLAATRVADVAPLTGLPRLTDLTLSHTPLRDVAPLARLPNLRALDIGATAVSDVSALADAANLVELQIAGTEVKDLTPLAGLSNLKAIMLGPYQDAAPLRHIEELTVGRYDNDGHYSIDGEWSFARHAPRR